MTLRERLRIADSDAEDFRSRNSGWLVPDEVARRKSAVMALGNALVVLAVIGFWAYCCSIPPPAHLGPFIARSGGFLSTVRRADNGTMTERT